MATPQTPAASKTGVSIIVVTALMLFSMFFGAGNLIFPPYLGFQAGHNFVPAILGFLATAVALPVLAIVAIALSGNNVHDLAARGGRLFGIVFPVLAYLSIGAFYALPRTGAVSFSTAIVPVTGWDGIVPSAIFNAIFFGITLALAFNPTEIVDKLGKFLTPALLVLLLILVTLSVTGFRGSPGEAADKYASNPFSAGLLQGYLTMDSIAGLAFGIVVVSALKFKKVPKGGKLVRATIIAGLIAGALLGAIYLGLGVIGQLIAEPSKYPDGAQMLAAAAHQAMGGPGQLVFGGIVLLACLTTSVGLVAATSEFFNTLLPGISYHAWAVLFSVMSFGMATMGLQTVLAIAAPVIGFIYPSAITLIFLTLIEYSLRGNIYFNWTYKLALAVAVVWAAAMTLVTLGWGKSVVEPLISWSPMHAVDLGWLLPTVVAAVIGLLIDVAKPTPRPIAPRHKVPSLA